MSTRRQQESQTEKRLSKRRKRASSMTRQIHNMGQQSKLATLVIVCCLLLIQTEPLPTDSAVIRPTIFSDRTTDEQPAPPPDQQQQPQQSQLTQPISHMNQIHQQEGTGQSPAQKINPLKSRFCTGPNNQRLDHALGLQSGQIDDLSLSASSFSNEQVRPHLARLNQNLLGGAWCPVKPIGPNTGGQEWIQVKLNRSFVVSAVETQGRFALGSGKEFAPHFYIVYSRNNGRTWHKWKNLHGFSLLRGNDDVNTAVRNELSPPIVGANVIRILPYSQHLRTVCLRLELFGCQYDEGAPIAYATTDGVIEPRWGHLIDYTYDGLRYPRLWAGLGQLVDGVRGPDNFSFNNGFEWVGWKSMNGDVVIEFTFKTLRNFTGALFHSNNLFSSGVEVFQAVDVHYGIDINLSMEAIGDSLRDRERRQQQQPSGVLSRTARQINEEQPTASQQQQSQAQQQQTVWSSDVLSIEYEPDKKIESSRPVTVHLKQRLANKLRFVLKFASKWILISEVEFLSHPVELMSLASINEQQTPQLMADLRLAKTYDQYVAILREHQLRRIAADEYLGNVLGSTTTTTTTTTTTPFSSGSTNNGDNFPQSDQQLEPKPMVPANQPSWVAEQPATNPMLSNQPPYQPMPNYYEQPQLMPIPTATDKTMGNDLFQNQQPPRTRTVGVATVISFVFVGVLGFVGVLFAVSSYRLRCRSPRHLHSGVSSKTGFMGSVFANSAASSSSSGGESSAGSLHHTNNFRHMTLAHQQQQQLAAAYQHQGQLRADSHYNPLFANNSSRSSNGSLKKSTGPLSTLKKLANLSTRATNLGGNSLTKHQDLLFSNQLAPVEQQPHQLLVSLKDSSSGKCKSSGKSQAISTQLIVGLNQANPLAHQQIYNQANYGLQQQGQNNPYNSTANSMSLTSSSTLNGTSGNQQAAEYSLAAGVDYATPDLQSGASQAHHFQPNHHHHNQLVGQPVPRQLFATGDLLRNSTRHTSSQTHQNRLTGAQMDHNYEQINGDQMPGGEVRFNGVANTLHHHHQRTFSNQQQQTVANGVCNQQQTFNSMTLGSGAFAPPSRVPRQPQQPVETSHYYYADTEAAKSCLGN